MTNSAIKPALSGRSSPIQAPPSHPATPPNGAASSSPPGTAQPEASTPHLPPSRTPSRTSLDGPGTQAPRLGSRLLATMSTAAGKAPEKAPQDAPKTAIRDFQPASDAKTEKTSGASAVDKVSTEAGPSSPPRRLLNPTAGEVEALRRDMLSELDQLGMSLVAAGHEPEAIRALRHPSAEDLEAALHALQGQGDHEGGEGGAIPEATPEHQQAAQDLQSFVDTGTAPHGAQVAHGQLATLSHQVIAEAVRNPWGQGLAEAAGAATGKFMRAGKVAQAFLQRVNANEDFQSTPGKIAASVANVAMRNGASVFLTTGLRQFLSYGIEAAMEKAGAGPAVRTTLGAAAPVIAAGALALGAMRDHVAGTQTSTSVRSRAIMGGAIAATGIATASTGAMAGAAPLMLAFTAYTAMRDLVVQSRLRLGNANTAGTKPDARHFAMISALYGLDQGLVNLGMSQLASPSGAGAMVARAGIKPANAFVRAAINWAGEIGEDLMFQSIPAIRSRLNASAERPAHALELSIKDVGYQKNHLANGSMGPFAVRTGILSMTIGLTSMIAPYVKNPKLLEAANDLIVGAVNAILYEPFANAGSAQPAAVSSSASVNGGVQDTNAGAPAETGMEMVDMSADARHSHQAHLPGESGSTAPTTETV